MSTNITLFPSASPTSKTKTMDKYVTKTNKRKVDDSPVKDSKKEEEPKAEEKGTKKAKV